MEIRLAVYRLNSDGTRKDLYKNIILHDDSLVFPLEHFLKVFSMLYPNSYIEITTKLS